MEDLSQLWEQLPKLMRRDRFGVARQLRRLQERAAKGENVRPPQRLLRQIQQSAKLRAERASRLPEIRYNTELPIVEKVEEIARAISTHRVVVVCGETGSGKSTQLPKVLLQLGYGISGMIGMTQPRRIAARTIAARIATELNCPLGQQVGYKVRFVDVTGPYTLIKVMTDGILLAETQGDRFLEQYDALIIDEAHERSLNIDFLIGYVTRLLKKRPDLKLVITSATIAPEKFTQHFAPICGVVPVVQVSGRTYPVEIRYRPIEPDDETDDPDWLSALAGAVEELMAEGPGDILAFLPTERDIHQAAKLLRGRYRSDPRVEILPLYARLSLQEQQRVFQPHKGRRIVLATNVAESSLTVPGIRYVVDLGTARIARYSARSKTQRLPIEPISQASADQRAGRCGRTGPGICIRLYSEEDYLSRERFTPPEIQRANLAGVVLTAKALRLGPVEQFPFLDPPRSTAIRDAHKTLFELGAVDEQDRLTRLGRRLSQLPVDPRIGRMILAADRFGCLGDVLVIAAALEVQDPRLRPAEKAESADQLHARFCHPESDFLTLLNLWDFYRKLKADLSSSRLRRACHENYLSYNRMREWADVYLQLLQLVSEAGMKPGPRSGDYEAIHKAILSGLLAHVACRTGTNEYTVAGGSTAYIWPGSALFEKRPQWIVAAEIVETTRRYLRCCARVEPHWIEQLGKHLLQYHYSDPYWSRKHGAAFVHERVSIFGLTLVAGRRVPYAPVDRQEARRLLIQHGLVEQQLGSNLPFLEHNRLLREQLQLIQAKLRRQLQLVGEWAEFDFYDRNLPPQVFDRATLVRWYRRESRRQKDLLCMQLKDLLAEPLPDNLDEQFPDYLETPAGNLPLQYRFEPGSPYDSVTVTVPLRALPQLDADRLEWLVPGYLPEKVLALLRTLPKPLRQQLTPLRQMAEKLLPHLAFGKGSLLVALAEQIARVTGVAVEVSHFELDRLPDYLLFNIKVVDDEGNVLGESRSLSELVEQLRPKLAQQVRGTTCGQWQRSGVVDWEWDSLPECVELTSAGVTLQAYPALVDERNSVALRLFECRNTARWHTRWGVRRLFICKARRQLERHIAFLPQLSRWTMFAAELPGWNLQEGLLSLLAERAFLFDEQVPRSRCEFEKRLQQGIQRLPFAVQEVVSLVEALLSSHHEARKTLEENNRSAFLYAISDVQEQLAHLTSATFTEEVPWQWLQHYPRYFRAIVLRFDKLRSGGLSRDRSRWESEFVPRWQRYLEASARTGQLGIFDPELFTYRWMLEEFRVQLFAEQLGTAVSVSSKRLDRQWERVQK